MKPELIITFTCEQSHEDMALLLEVIAGEIRLGCSTGSAPEYSWKFFQVRDGFP
jgi:hypothetical protein